MAISAPFTENPSSPPDHDLLLRLYQGPLDPQPWRGFLGSLRRHLASHYANLAFHGVASTPGGIVATEDADEDCSAHGARYAATYGDLDPIPYLSMKHGDCHLMTDLIIQAGPAGDRFYREFMQPAGMDQMIMLHVAEPGGTRAWVSVARRNSARGFDADDLVLMRALTPHLATALEMFAALARTGRECSLYRNAVNHLAIGTIILDGGGQILAVDEPAARILAANPALAVRRDRLHIRQGADDKSLQQLIQAGLACAAGGYCRAMRPQHQPQLGLLVRTIDGAPRRTSATAPALAVHISDSRMERLTPERQLMALLGLTATEAGLTVQLAQGRSLIEAAQVLGLTEQTVRTYSKQIYAKTGVRRQSDLVRLVLTSVARLAD